jgi:hypothetical protein
MTLQASGDITLKDIQAEFGGANPISLSEYYRGGAYVVNQSINNNIPTSGSIQLSDFYLAKGTGNLTFEYIGSVNNTGNAYSYTFVNVPIGTATSDRLVVIAVQINVSESTSYYISDVAINGASTPYIARSASGKNCWLVQRVITTGTTADVVVTLAGSGTPGRCTLMVYNVGNYTSSTPVITVSGLNGTTSISRTISYKSGMVVIANAFQYTEPTGFTWTGLTEDRDSNIEDSRHTSASGRISSNSGTITITSENTTVPIYASLAVWR